MEPGEGSNPFLDNPELLYTHNFKQNIRSFLYKGDFEDGHLLKNAQEHLSTNAYGKIVSPLPHFLTPIHSSIVDNTIACLLVDYWENHA